MLLGKEQTDIRKEIEILKRCADDNIVRYFGSATKDNYLWVRERGGTSELAEIRASDDHRLSEREREQR